MLQEVTDLDAASFASKDTPSFMCDNHNDDRADRGGGKTTQLPAGWRRGWTHPRGASGSKAGAASF